MVYRRSFALVATTGAPRAQDFAFEGQARSVLGKLSLGSSRCLKRRNLHDDDEEVALFKRVRIKTEVSFPMVIASLPGSEGPYIGSQLRRLFEILNGEDIETPSQSKSNLN
jgi:hypothetical protein